MQSLHPISERTFAIKAHSCTNTRKNKPLCSHCNLLGHTKDMCYKLIGYPPGYNYKNWSSSNSSRGKGSQVIHTNFMVSQQSSSTITEAFTPDQCQQLIAMLTSQLQSASTLDIRTNSINTSMQGKIMSHINALDFRFNLLSISALLKFSDLSVLDFFLPKVVYDMVDASYVHGIEQVPLGSTDFNGGASLGPTDSTDGASPESADSHDDVPSEPIALTDDVSIPVRRSSRTIQKLSFLQQYYCNNSPFEHSLFTRGCGNGFIALLVYVDDIVLAGEDLQALHEIPSPLQKHFKLKELGPLRYFMGFEIARSNYGIILSQRKYALQLLEDTSCLGAKPAELPMPFSSKLSANERELLSDYQEYRQLIGRLLYLTNTRPDIVHCAFVEPVCFLPLSTSRDFLKALYGLH
ncbi:PI206-like protein [Hibiscus syriacus]|uniref:PI206-like protein n=1 Tax=Hibiscus syriacus TaxID=106335 RepID=A0A6A2Y2T9_HIBSY|nr:PI206-like protein [Hibiscus syriacus]